MDENRLKTLIEKYLSGTTTDTEKAELESWYLEHNEELPQQLSQSEITEETDQIWERIQQDEAARRNPNWKRYASVAAAVLVLTAGGLFYFNKHQKPQQLAQNKSHELPPATNRAILKTGGGQTLVLSRLPAGQVNVPSQSSINKTASEELVYANSGSETTVTVYDTLVVPRGSKSYHLVLSDGTDLWLNAATIFRYPEKFASNKREVELISGEMLFKVAYNVNAPFTIKTHGQVLRDLGTQFNVSAYDDDADVCTTLLEGSVSVSKNNNSIILKPGQAAIVNNQNGGIMLDKNADTEMAIAWKNGLFQFDNTPLKEVMKQLARWYNVNVVYEGNIGDRAFTGKLYRDVNASQLLDILTYNKIHYRIDGKTLTITP